VLLPVCSAPALPTLPGKTWLLLAAVGWRYAVCAYKARLRKRRSGCVSLFGLYAVPPSAMHHPALLKQLSADGNAVGERKRLSRAHLPAISRSGVDVLRQRRVWAPDGGGACFAVRADVSRLADPSVAFAYPFLSPLSLGQCFSRLGDMLTRISLFCGGAPQRNQRCCHPSLLLYLILY